MASVLKKKKEKKEKDKDKEELDRLATLTEDQLVSVISKIKVFLSWKRAIQPRVHYWFYTFLPNAASIDFLCYPFRVICIWCLKNN